MPENEYSKFLVRLTPKTRAMLDAAHKDKEMPRAHIVNLALKSYLKEYSNASINERLNALNV